MANNNIQPTHEAIHTGLSGLGQDEKWKDMLNFRSQQNRTQVVPHKYLWFSAGCAKLHSFIAGLNGHALAIGEHQSFGFVGSDAVNAYQLWRLTQRFLNGNSNRDAQSQQLLVQGSYTGTSPVKLRVHYVAGRLIPFWNTPDPMPAPPADVVPDFGCDPDDSDGSDDLHRHTLNFIIRNHDLSLDGEIEYLKDVRIIVQRAGDDNETSYTDAHGRVSFLAMKRGFYTITLFKEGFLPKVYSHNLTTTTTLTYELVEDNPAWATLGYTYPAYTFIRRGVGYSVFEDAISPPSTVISTLGGEHYYFLTSHTMASADTSTFPEDIIISADGWYHSGVGFVTVLEGSYYVYKHKLYLCLATHFTSDLTFRPGEGASWTTKWRLVAVGLNYATNIFDWGAFYEVGQKVRHGGSRYRCVNRHQPIYFYNSITATPGNWELLP